MCGVRPQVVAHRGASHDNAEHTLGAYVAALGVRGLELGTGVRVLGSPIVTVADGSSISIGPGTSLVSLSEATALGVSRPVILRTLLPRAVISIGRDCGLSGTAICAALSIVIGDRVLFGADVMVADTDFHPVDAMPRRFAPLARGDGN